jgi:hypothetical protein
MSPAIAMAAVAAMTMDMVGANATAIAPSARTSAAAVMEPRLQRVASMNAPIGELKASATKPLNVLSPPMAAGFQPSCVSRKMPI